MASDQQTTPPRYRLLIRGERIQPEDECLRDDAETWGRLAGFVIGMEYLPAAMMPVRRPVRQA